MKKLFAYMIAVCILMGALTQLIPVASAEGIPEDYSQKQLKYFGKSMLNEDEKYIYELFESNLTDITDLKGEIKVDKEKQIAPETVMSALSMFINDHPECFWLASQISYSMLDDVVISVKPGYYMEGESLINTQKALESIISEVLTGMQQSLANANDYEKALYLHDAVASITDYQKEGLHQSALGALVYGKAVCAGYAAAYQLLLNRAGISAFTVTGDSIDPITNIPEPHAWTLMEIDGKCVYADVTWDDQGENLYRAYFALSKDEMEKTHFTGEEYILPSCNHNDMSYADIKGAKFSDEDGAQAFSEFVTKINDTTCLADIFYSGDDLNAWIGENLLEIYELIGGKGRVSVSLLSVENEYHITITGDFSQSSKPDVPIAPPVELPTTDTSDLEIPDGDIIFREDETDEKKEAEAPTLSDDKHNDGVSPNEPEDNGVPGSASKVSGGCISSLSGAFCVILSAISGIAIALKKSKNK